MLDVSGPDGSLRPGDVVTVDDLQRAEEAAKVDVQEGDVVCIHTGWGQWFGVDNARYVSGEPGIDVPAMEWLISRGVVAIAADNPAVEVIPNPRADQMLPVHQHTLTDAGVYLIENLNSAALASRGCHAFCFMLLAALLSRCNRLPGAARCIVVTDESGESMSLIDQLNVRQEEGRPIRIGMIGAGKFGTMFPAQVLRIPGMHVVGVVYLGRGAGTLEYASRRLAERSSWLLPARCRLPVR